MTHTIAAPAQTALLRRALCTAGILFCLLMATTNIAGAFAAADDVVVGLTLPTTHLIYDQDPVKATLTVENKLNQTLETSVLLTANLDILDNRTVNVLAGQKKTIEISIEPTELATIFGAGSDKPNIEGNLVAYFYFLDGDVEVLKSSQVTVSISKTLTTQTTVDTVVTVPPTTSAPTTAVPTTAPPTTSAPTTTLPAPTTTQPVGTKSATVDVSLSKSKAFFSDKIVTTAKVSNTGTAILDDVTVTILTAGREYRNFSIESIAVGSSQVVVFEGNLEAGRFVTLLDEETMEFDLTGDFAATVCWTPIDCVSDSEEVEVVDAVIDFGISAGTDGTNRMEITNLGTTTITDLVVSEASYGEIVFSSRTLEPGDTVTADWDFEPIPGVTRLAVTATGTATGLSGTLFAFDMDLTDLVDPDPEDPEVIVSTTVPPVDTTATTIPVAVGGEQLARTSASGDQLPFTGSSNDILFSGLWILMAGVMLMCFKEGFARRAMTLVKVNRGH